MPGTPRTPGTPVPRARKKRRSTKPPSSPEIPDKAFFRIGEVARIVGVAAHVVRFWEREFPGEVKPTRSGRGQRVYRHADVEALLRIKSLRYADGLDVEGARRRLRVARGEEQSPVARLAGELRAAVESLLEVIDEDETHE